MKRLLILIVGIGMFFCIGTHAQEVALVSDKDFLSEVFKFVTGFKGLGGMALAAAVVQLIIKFLSTEFCGKVFKKMTGQGKLTIVSGLSVVSGVIALKMAGLETVDSILHATTLAALQVFAHQLYKQFYVKKIN